MKIEVKYNPAERPPDNVYRGDQLKLAPPGLYRFRRTVLHAHAARVLVISETLVLWLNKDSIEPFRAGLWSEALFITAHDNVTITIKPQ